MENILDRVPQLRPRLKLRPEHFGALLFIGGLPPLSLNHDAYRVLQLVDGQRSVCAIIEALLSSRPDESDIGLKVVEFFHLCLQAKLVTI